MPFTIGGDWIPEKTPEKPKKKVKVVLEKRRNSILTVILYLNMDEKQMKDLASNLKKKLGCGGAVKDGRIEVQGDKVALVEEFLRSTLQ